MSSVSRILAIALAASCLGAAAAEPLRVCADPNNLPFSNERGEGFENAIARLIAEDLGRPLEYAWWPQRRGFVRNTLKAGKCDLVIGVPAGYDLVATGRPYYASTYVFVTRADRHLDIGSLDDPRLRTLTIGLHAIGVDYANVPPAQALAQRGIVGNIRGYSIYGDYSRPDPPRELIDAVARGDVDVAIAWGPLAGYFAAREPVGLVLRPVSPAVAGPGLPMTFRIAMGTRHGDAALGSAVASALDRHRGDVREVLRRYRVPLVEDPS